MRIRSGQFAALIVSFAILGACAREPMEAAYVDEQIPPEAGMSEPLELAGGPGEDAEDAAYQAEHDAYLAHLASRGLIAERRIDPDTGQSVLVVSNRPIPNPVLFGGPSRRAPRVAQSGRKGGRYESPGPVHSPPRPAARAAVSEVQPTAPVVATAPAPAAQPAAPSTAHAAVVPTPVPVDAADAADAGFRMTPAVWAIIAAAVLALLALLFFANRPRKRTRYSSRQAPAEASGGEAHA